MKRFVFVTAFALALIASMGQANSCGVPPPSSDQVQAQRTETLAREAFRLAAAKLPIQTTFVTRQLGG